MAAAERPAVKPVNRVQATELSRREKESESNRETIKTNAAKEGENLLLELSFTI